MGSNASQLDTHFAIHSTYL